MQYQNRIKEILRRADAINVPVAELLRAADLHPSVWYRWQKPDANPRVRSVNTACDVMEQALTQREMAMAERLLERMEPQLQGEAA
jgi:hypothetical protein